MRIGDWGPSLTIFCLFSCSFAMRLDVDRLAAREEIERKWDEIEYGVKSRKLRQIQPKEISIQVTAPLFSSRLFEHGAAAGDSELPQALDVGKKIELTYPINFFGENYNTIYILSNGAIGFEANSRSYKAGILPGPTKIIAPFWNRNDLRNGGHVHYREVTRGRVLERGQSEIRYQYDKNVKVKSALIVTWDRMQPLNTAALPEENANTFQAAIFNTDNGTFANFIYSNIGWTQGGESGFSAGDATNHFKLPTSGTPNIMYLEEYGNTGIPGEWMFELSEVRVISCKSGIKGDTCDQECSSGEWGPDCAYCCHCAEGTCHAVSGECNKGCSTCWTGVACQERQEKCSVKTQCATNALSFNDYDRCGEPIQRCQCLNGYKGDGYKQCDDIDECSKNSTICHKNAICTNTPGRYFCQCKEGFTGDGSTECSSTLLFQYDTHQQLPRKKNARVEVTLRHPMKIFGDNVDKLMISSNGLIATSDVADLHAAHLEDMKITGVAPFFSLIDISRSGAVTVEEVDDVELLRRLTRTIAENYNDPGFEARSALVVTFSNVTTARSQSGNTFQTLLIDGTSARNEKQTFAQILYKDVDWTENAEVGILSKDSSSTILLPGSGTEGVRQLAKSSNIKQPGAWLYRIDRAQVQPCAQSIQIPPLCDRLQTSLSTSNNKEARLPKLPAKIPDEKSEDLTLPTPKVFEIDQPIGTIRPSIQQHTSLSFDNDPTTTQLLTQTPKATTRPSKPRPSFSSTPHRPIVSLSDEDFEVGPDAFEVTFPPFINVVPQLQTSRPLPDFSLKTTDVEVSRTTLQTTTQMTTTELTTQSTTAMTSSMTLEADYDVESVPEPSRISLEEERMRLHKVAQMKPEFAEPPQAFGTQKAVPPSSAEMMKEPSRKPPRVEVVAKMPNKEPDVEFADDSEKRNEESNTIFVFSSTTLKPPSRKVTTAQPTTQAPSTDMKSFKNNIVTASPRPNSPEAGNAEEQSDKKLAIILPLSIIGAWLMILLCIATFVCCKKRQSRDAASHLRALYGNNYGVRPTSYEAKRKETSYEDHLERAARLTGQSPLASTQGLGKVSLYGSYWNLQQQHMDTPSTSSHSPSRMSHHSPVGYRHSNIDRGGYPNTRYTYTGHY